MEGAKTVVNDYGGALPSDPEVLIKKIEGIGPYTAGAIASIAYGVQTPTVDGNVRILLLSPNKEKSIPKALICLLNPFL